MHRTVQSGSNLRPSSNATEQYFSVVLFIMLYKVVLTFKPVDQNPKE